MTVDKVADRPATTATRAAQPPLRPRSAPTLGLDRLDVPTILHLQRTAGNAAVVQRLASTAALQASAGAPSKKSHTYRGFITSVDDYHQLSTQLWTAPATGPDFHRQLDAALTAVVTTANAFIKSKKKSKKRATAVTDVTKIRDEVPAERALVQDLAAEPGFDTFDRTRPFTEVARGAAGAAKNPAVLRDAGVTADGAPPDGHGMAVWARVDMGRSPYDPNPGLGLRTVYGVSFEYWEDVEFTHDFVEADPTLVAARKIAGDGAKRKQWNDVYAIQPEGATFDKTSAPIQVSWTQAVEQAKAKAPALVGIKTVGIYDKPALDPLVGRYAHRLLRFRIVFKDALGARREIHAQQIVEMTGQGGASLRTYRDTLGNKVGIIDDGGGGGERPMGRRDPAIAKPTTKRSAIQVDVPKRARDAVGDFRQQIAEERAKPFQFAELEQMKGRIPGEDTRKFAYKEFTRKGSMDDVTKPGTRYEVAAWNLVPYPESGWAYKEYVLAGGGQLVAVVAGKQILKMYYTDNTTVRLATSSFADWDVRSFAEIPIETVVPQPTALPPGMLAAFVSKKALVQYVQAHHAEYGRIAQEYKQRFGDVFLTDVEAYLKEHFQSVGASSATYRQVRDSLPTDPFLILRLEAAYGAVAGADRVAPARLDHLKLTGLGALVNALSNRKPARGLLNIITTNPGRSAEIEATFNTLKAPATFGQVVHDAFVARLKRDGDGKTVYLGMVQTFGDVEYLLRAAYRSVFGNTRLTALLKEIRTDVLTAAVPQPDSRQNKRALRAFKAAGPFTVRDFTPSTAGRFDATYNPTTGQLDISIRCAFDFKDHAVATATQNTGATGTLAQKAWDPGTRLAYLHDLQQVVSTAWSGKFQIVNDRPGWGSLPPVQVAVSLAEVPLGKEQFLISVTKAILADKTAGPYISPSPAEGGRSFVITKEAVVSLQEYDVKDKMTDPVFHQYLHATEKSQHVSKAYSVDRDRLVQAVANAGPVTFSRGTRLGDQQQYTNLIGEFQRLPAYSSFTKFQAIVIKAGARPNEDPAVAARRARKIEKALQGLGYTTITTDTTGDSRLATLEVPEDAAAKLDYEARWTRISAAHEVGHMLGLDDEYNATANLKLLKRLIAEGLVPPDTPADHLNPAGEALKNASSHREQGAMADLLGASGLPTPDFTTADAAKSSSIMTAGMDIMAAHYITIQEALGALTKDHVDPMFWRINA